MVKCSFKTDDDSPYTNEYLWLRDIQVKGDANNPIYYGNVANRPLHIKNLAEGQTVSFDEGDIVDWMYHRNGRIMGGLSIKYLIEKMPPYSTEPEGRALLELFDDSY
jgi:uncharacterized protein YegJ (DUF2314 family)